MDFSLTEGQKALQTEIRNFCKHEVTKEIIEKHEDAGEVPFFLIEKMKELGLLGVIVPPEYGGLGLGTTEMVVIGEELSRAWTSLFLVWGVQNGLGTTSLLYFGSEMLKRKYIPRIINGDLACFGLTEPGCGSDSANIQLMAKKVDGGYCLSGSKTFISNAIGGKIITVFARTGGPELPRHKGISCFITDLPAETGKEENGIIVEKFKKGKMGQHASPIATITFAKTFVPEDHRIGELNQGFKIAMQTLDSGRVGVASQAVGIAQAALDEAIQYAKTRVAFGQPIANFEMIQEKLANMQTYVDAARLLTYKAAWLQDNGQPFVREASEAKLFASEFGMKVCDMAVQIFGGSGYVQEYPVERLFRDMRALPLYEGTSEIQRIVIAKAITSER